MFITEISVNDYLSIFSRKDIFSILKSTKYSIQVIH